MESGKLGFRITKRDDCLMSPMLFNDCLLSISVCFGKSLSKAEELGQFGVAGLAVADPWELGIGLDWPIDGLQCPYHHVVRSLAAHTILWLCRAAVTQGTSPVH